MRYYLGGRCNLVAFLPKYACENTVRAPTVHLSLGGCYPPAGVCGGAGGGGYRISDITERPRNPALTRVITGPNGPPDNCKLSIAEVTCGCNLPVEVTCPESFRL